MSHSYEDSGQSCRGNTRFRVFGSLLCEQIRVETIENESARAGEGDPEWLRSARDRFHLDHLRVSGQEYSQRVMFKIL